MEERRETREAHATNIGSFTVGFDIVIGNLDKSVYKGNQIVVNWLEQVFTPSESISDVIEARWSKLRKQRDRCLEDGQLARLVSYSEVRNKIVLTLQPTSYRIFITTNLELDSPAVPHPEGGRYMSIRELAGSEGLLMDSPYLANPLNVIAMIITNDDFTFTPTRSAFVYESPNTLQASVGGALEPKEHPATALVREIKEEWGILIEENEIEFLVLGINQRTAEPDLIAMVKTKLSEREVFALFKTHNRKDEFTFFESLELNEQNLGYLVSILREREWSQPSDQAAFLITLIRKFGARAIEKVLQT